MRDVVPVNFKEPTQVRTRIRTTKPIRTQHGVRHRHERADLVRIRTHVVGGGNRRALAAFQQLGHIRLALLTFRMQAVGTFHVETIATQFVEARAAPDVGGHAEVLVQQLGRGNGFAQDGARTQQLHAQLALLRLAGVGQQVHALDDAFGRAFRHFRVGVVLVHQGDVVVLVNLIFHHRLGAVLQDHRHFEAEGRVVAAHVRNATGHQMAEAVFVLQAFTVQRGAAGGTTQQEAAGTHVRCLPGDVAHALEAEHRVVDVERQHRHVADRVAGTGGHPRADRTRLADALLQHLAALVFAVEHQLVGVDRLVLLAKRRVDADLAEQAFHAEGTGFVGHDRHDVRAQFLVTQGDVQALHEGHGGGVAALAAALQQALVAFQLRCVEALFGLAAALRQVATQRGAAFLQVLHFRRIRARVVERHLAVGQLRVGHRNVEAVAEVAHRFVVQLLGLVGRVQCLTGAAHAVALDRLGQDHGRHALGVHGLVVGGVHLVRVVATTVQAPDVVVGQTGHHRSGFRVLAEEMLAGIRPAEGLAVLVFAVDGFHHQLFQDAVGVLGQQGIPVTAPQQLDDIPAAATEHAFQFLDDLAVAAHRAVQALQVAVHHEDQVVQAFTAGQCDGTEGFRLVALAVADEAPHLAVGLLDQATVFQVAHELRLVDGGQRAQAHRHGRGLPVFRHQPRMRVRRQAAAVHFHAELVQLLFADAAFQEGTRVDARGAVALDEQQVARMAFARGAPEVVEAHVVQRCAGGERGDVAAQVTRLAVGAHHGGHRVPADDRTDAPFQFGVARALGLQLRLDGVDVFGSGRERQIGTRTTGQFHHAFQQLMRALGALDINNGLQRLDPLLGFHRIRVVVQHLVQPVH
ncbi:hypothetical protein D3C75_428630 [compost metagenome]